MFVDTCKLLGQVGINSYSWEHPQGKSLAIRDAIIMKINIHYDNDLL